MCQMEFIHLSNLTGDSRYAAAAEHVIQYLHDHMQKVIHLLRATIQRDSLGQLPQPGSSATQLQCSISHQDRHALLFILLLSLQAP